MIALDVKYTSSLLQQWGCHETWLTNITKIAPPPYTYWLVQPLARAQNFARIFRRWKNL